MKEKKDYTKIGGILLGALTAGLIFFMIFGISKLNTEKEIKRADLLVEEKSYQAAIDMYDDILSRKNSPEVKEKRELALELMDPDKKAAREEKEAAESAKDKDKDQAEEDGEEAEEETPEEITDETEETEETEDEDQEASEDMTDEEKNLPKKSVWAKRANIRTQPSESASVVSVITEGTEIYITDEQVESSKRTWYKIIVISNGSRIEGWMASNTLNN